MQFRKIGVIDVDRIKKDFGFIRTEYGLDIINEETTNSNDCIFVSYSNKKGREIRIVRDRGYYEVETSIGTGYTNISFIAKYLYKDKCFRIEYKGFDGYISLVNDSKRKLLMIKDYERKINQEEIDKYFKENAKEIEWIKNEET